MHTLYTTNAFILSSAPHGESNRVYRLLTETHGLLYAHAQSVRELRNRNRYALRSVAYVNVTLVRGREVWRLASARTVADVRVPPHPAYRRLLDLIGRVTPVEDPFTQTFRIFFEHARALDACEERDTLAIELIGIVRILAERGYLAARGDVADLIHDITSDAADYTPSMCERVTRHRTPLLVSVNSALRSASE